MAYMNFMKEAGYESLHIWSCPPKPGVDYIFFRHPKDQKYPSRPRLKIWYEKLLDLCIQNGIASNYSDITTNTTLKSIHQVPYFEGDFWPDALEYCIKANPNQTAEQLFGKLIGIIKKHKHSFFIVNLCCSTKASINILGPFQFSSLVDDRVNLLTTAHDNNLEFSDIRRAKFSTLFMLKMFHLSEIHFTCYDCEEDTQISYKCVSCKEFYLCIDFVQNAGHEHEMVLNSESSGYTLSELLEALLHASSCKTEKCQIFCCNKMKQIFEHTTKCGDDNCFTCNKFLNLCYHHARFCQYDQCLVNLCSEMKVKVESERLINR